MATDGENKMQRVALYSVLGVYFYFFKNCDVIVMMTASFAFLSVGSGQSIMLPCCRTLFNETPGKISKCYEQLPRWRCNIHAYV